MQVVPPTVNLAEIQKSEEMRQKQLDAEEAERRAQMAAQVAELEAIHRRKQQAMSWKEKYIMHYLTVC